MVFDERVCLRLPTEMRDAAEGLIMEGGYRDMSALTRTAICTLVQKEQTIQQGVEERGWVAARQADPGLRGLVSRTNQYTFSPQEPASAKEYRVCD